MSKECSWNEDPNKKFEMVKTIFEQNFLHTRIAATERHWYTNIYILTVAGALTFLSASNIERFLGVIFFLLLILSLSGMFISLKLGGEIGNIHRKNDKLMRKYFPILKSDVGFPLIDRRWSVTRLRYIYPLIYSSTSGIWITLLVNPSSNISQVVVFGLLGLFVGIGLDALFFDL